MKRKPAVGGKFYPQDPDALLRNVKSHTPKVGRKVRAIGIVVPHAGFFYSGDVAGSVYAKIEILDTVVLLGPNHTGRGPLVSLMLKGIWDMPAGEIGIDALLARSIFEASPLVEADVVAHQNEHSLETQIPFIQYFRKDFKIVPICLKKISLDNCRILSEAIMAGLKKLKRTALIVASSDMTHYESHESASKKDNLAIAQILKRNPEGLFHTVQENQISMCGVVPATVMLMTGNQLGAEKAKLIQYMTSGQVSGRMDHVVGYAGMIIQ